MKEEMQGFHMTPNFLIFISEKSLLNHLYTFKCVAPGMSETCNDADFANGEGDVPRESTSAAESG